MADGDSDGGMQIGDGADGDGGGADDNDRDNTTGDGSNSESTDDKFIPITVEEVSKLFSKCKVGNECGPDYSMYICTYFELTQRKRNVYRAHILHALNMICDRYVVAG